ncbi:MULTISPECIES: hypothetical protein [unclassified Brevundimonas]|uniref:hypothetical protein n=1 Tax=unclassified Brevundimonas TaxID=2622653 RepID=UPI0025BA9BB6|nr:MULTISPECIES: hypothetical protein [unclassified Brevundimonas]
MKDDRSAGELIFCKCVKVRRRKIAGFGKGIPNGQCPLPGLKPESALDSSGTLRAAAFGESVAAEGAPAATFQKDSNQV